VLSEVDTVVGKTPTLTPSAVRTLVIAPAVFSFNSIWAFSALCTQQEKTKKSASSAALIISSIISTSITNITSISHQHQQHYQYQHHHSLPVGNVRQFEIQTGLFFQPPSVFDADGDPYTQTSFDSTVRTVSSAQSSKQQVTSNTKKRTSAFSNPQPPRATKSHQKPPTCVSE
jgi:hypothetical protein